jgi:hypothetical protein
MLASALLVTYNQPAFTGALDLEAFDYWAGALQGVAHDL